MREGVRLAPVDTVTVPALVLTGVISYCAALATAVMVRLAPVAVPVAVAVSTLAGVPAREKRYSAAL